MGIAGEFSSIRLSFVHGLRVIEARRAFEQGSIPFSRRWHWLGRWRFGQRLPARRVAGRPALSVERFKIRLPFRFPSPSNTPEVRRLARIGDTRLISYRHWVSGRCAFLRKSRWRQLREVSCAFVRVTPPFLTNSCRN
jgi:hypothetical protein